MYCVNSLSDNIKLRRLFSKIVEHTHTYMNILSLFRLSITVKANTCTILCNYLAKCSFIYVQFYFEPHIYITNSFALMQTLLSANNP